MIYRLNSTLHELLVVALTQRYKLALGEILGKLAASETSSARQVLPLRKLSPPVRQGRTEDLSSLMLGT